MLPCPFAYAFLPHLRLVDRQDALQALDLVRDLHDQSDLQVAWRRSLIRLKGLEKALYSIRTNNWRCLSLERRLRVLDLCLWFVQRLSYFREFINLIVKCSRRPLSYRISHQICVLRQSWLLIVDLTQLSF